MLRAFFDASKTFPQKNSFPSLAVGGFVGKAEAWTKFQKQWREVRQKSGIEFFQTTEFMAGIPPYHTWDERKKRAILSKMFSLIRLMDFGVIAAISKVEYDALDRPTKDRFHDNPYLWCASYCLGLAARRLKKEGINESVMYVFESGDQGEPQFKHAMHRLLKSSERFKDEYQIHSIIPGLKRQFPGLDSADFLAWEAAQYCSITAGISSYSPRLNMQTIWQVIPIESCYMDRASIESLRDRNTPGYMRELAAEFGIKLGKASRQRPYQW
jgi:hypothetical protein